MTSDFRTYIAAATASIVLASCASGSRNASGGELTGVGAATWAEPAPYGMALVDRGSIKAGPQESDSLWDSGPTHTAFRSTPSGWMKPK